jgi:hypothetical protein
MASQTSVEHFLLEFKPDVGKSDRPQIVSNARMAIMGSASLSLVEDPNQWDKKPHEVKDRVWKLSVTNQDRFDPIRSSLEEFFVLLPFPAIRAPVFIAQVSERKDPEKDEASKLFASLE